MSLPALVEALTALGELRRRGREVSGLLRAAAVAPPDGLSWRAHGYTRNLIHRGARFELLLLCWSAGAVSPVHDHGGAECWFLPLAGAFDLEDFGPTLRPLGRRREVRGLDHQPGGAQIHRVRVSAGAPAALSLHVYAAPVDRCRVFDLKSRRWRWHRLEYDAVIAQPQSLEPVLSTNSR